MNAKTTSKGTNGHAKATPSTQEMLTALAASLGMELRPIPRPPVATPAPVPPVVVAKAKPEPKPERRQKAKPVAPEKPRALRPEDYPEHEHTTARILAAKIPTAGECLTGVDGAGILLRVVCHCGIEGWLEVPAADAEVMAQTAVWQDE